MRIAVVFDNFGPYHLARLAAAARQMRVLGVEIAAKSAEYAWDAPGGAGGLEQVRLLDAGARRSDWRLLRALYDQKVAAWAPDVIALPGWSAPAALAGAQWAARRRIPAIVMSDSNAHDFSRRAVSELVKRRLLTLFQAGLCAGTLSRAYLVDLGLDPERIFIGYDVVDNDHFAKGAAAMAEGGGMPEGVPPAWRGRYFLASARFVAKKNLPRLVDAFARYREMAGAEAWPLVLLGDGEMRGELERRRAALGLEDVLAMPGFKQYGELPRYYGTAGAFILASTTEQWGLVVNEAMASGLPVLVSARCGCAFDLVENGRNGAIFDPGDADALARLMCEIAGDAAARSAMGQASRDIIAGWAPERFADGLRQAAEVALPHGPARPGVVERTLLWTLSHRP